MELSERQKAYCIDFQREEPIITGEHDGIAASRANWQVWVCEGGRGALLKTEEIY